LSSRRFPRSPPHPMPPPETAPTALCARPASHLVARPLTWLWPHRLPLGKLAILDGDPGLGKSLGTLDLCTRLTTRPPFPDDRPGPGPANAIVINGEDGEEDTIAPRLRALVADLERIFVLHREGSAGGLPLRVPTHVAELDRVLTQTRAHLVILDPIAAFLHPSIQLASDVGVRQALLPLAELAAKHECVVLLVRHLNKSGGPPAPHRRRGPIALFAPAPS